MGHKVTRSTSNAPRRRDVVNRSVRSSDPVLRLQRTAGNSAVSSLLGRPSAQRQSEDDDESQDNQTVLTPSQDTEPTDDPAGVGPPVGGGTMGPGGTDEASSPGGIFGGGLLGSAVGNPNSMQAHDPDEFVPGRDEDRVGPAASAGGHDWEGVGEKQAVPGTNADYWKFQLGIDDRDEN